MRSALKTLVLSIALTGSPALAQNSAPAAIPVTVPQCLSCHGANGRPALADVPIIAGQQELYLVNALKAYRDGGRASGQALVMAEMVHRLSDNEIVELAKWFGEQQ